MKIELNEKEISELYSLHVLENDETQEENRKKFINLIFY